MRSKAIKISAVTLFFLFFLIGYYYPFELEKQYCDHFSLCRVKFGVYIYDYNSEDGRTYFGKDIQFGEKVGGIYEYFGLKEIKCGNEDIDSKKNSMLKLHNTRRFKTTPQPLLALVGKE